MRTAKFVSIIGKLENNGGIWKRKGVYPSQGNAPLSEAFLGEGRGGAKRKERNDID